MGLFSKKRKNQFDKTLMWNIMVFEDIDPSFAARVRNDEVAEGKKVVNDYVADIIKEHYYEEEGFRFRRNEDAG